MNKFPSKETVERLRKQYPAGTRVELVRMTIFCIWDRGSSLGVVYGEDLVKKL